MVQVVTQIRAHQARASSEALQIRDSVRGLRRRIAELEAPTVSRWTPSAGAPNTRPWNANARVYKVVPWNKMTE